MSVTPFHFEETKAQGGDGSCLLRRSVASWRLDEGTQVQEFCYVTGHLEGREGFSLLFSRMVLPPPAFQGLDGVTGLGKHGETRKNKHWPFPFILQLVASPASFCDPLRAESGALKRQGWEGGKQGCVTSWGLRATTTGLGGFSFLVWTSYRKCQ